MTANGKLEKILVATLENLSSSSFKSFRNNLNHCDLPKGHDRIPWNKLEEADATGVVKLIIRHYTTENGPQIVIKVLKDINERQASLDLEKKLPKKNGKTTKGGKTPGSQKKAKNPNSASTTPKNSEDAYCYEGLLKNKKVGKSQIGSCGSNLEDHTSHATSQAEETNLNFTPEINILPVLIETFDSVGPSTDSTNMLKEESIYIPVDEMASTAHKNQQRENNGKSKSVMQNISNRPLTGHTNKPNIKHIRPKGKPLQDLKLPVLKKGKRDLLEKHCKNKPHIYTRLLFEHFVQYETYTTWYKNTNFNGYKGKNAIPKNLSVTIQKEVQKKFPLGNNVDKDIRKEINRLLATLITTGWGDLTSGQE